MAGVAGPMLRRARGGGVRFLAGLAAGGIAAGAILALPVYLLGSLLQDLLPVRARLGVLALVCLGFALADLADRTPHPWRQVPQRLVHQLPPGALGLAWGFDLGLLLTTQKVVSLLWVALAAVLLLDPAVAGAVLTGFAAAAVAPIAAWSVAGRVRDRPVGAWERVWQRRVRRASGLTLLVMLAVTVGEVLSP